MFYLNVFHEAFVTGFFPRYYSGGRVNIRNGIEEYLVAGVGDSEGGNRYFVCSESVDSQ